MSELYTSAHHRPSDVPIAGKIPAETFERVIRRRLGTHCQEVLVGPAHGLDAGIVDLGNGTVMAVTTDPFFVMPEYGWERAAWFAVHIVASDLATTALGPAYCTVDLNLPLAMKDDELEALWEGVHAAAAEIGMAIVSGHTGRYDGCAYPMLGAATIIGIGAEKSYVTPAMARPGDAVIVTKGAAIETTGQLGLVFFDRIKAACGLETARAARELFSQMSVVRDAAVAVEAGVRDRGVTSMHDATERGVWGGLREIADASQAGMVVHQGAIIVRPEVYAVCTLFGIDPYSASSEGTLLLTCRPKKARSVLSRLHGAGIEASQVGEMTPKEEGVRVVQDGREHPLAATQSDPFWPAFQRAMDDR